MKTSVFVHQCSVVKDCCSRASLKCTKAVMGFKKNNCKFIRKDYVYFLQFWEEKANLEI